MLTEALQSVGAQLYRDAATPCMPELIEALQGAAKSAGVRLHGNEQLKLLLGPESCIGKLVASIMGSAARPVRALLFNKTADVNWPLGWHQDRTICVRRRENEPGFGPWSVKRGMIHVEPPPHLMDSMITIRVHLDDTGEDNAPLVIAPGSHRLGRIPVDEIAATVDRCGAMPCLANAGDIWVYSTPIVHASERARKPMARRVLQVDYADFDLPGELQWLGI